MSLTFTQILSQIDREAKSSTASYSVADKTADVNVALDFVLSTIFKAGGTWQFDDSNHTDYPIITTNIVSGQRDYGFVTDQQGNLILDIYKVVMAQPDGTFVDITPTDVQSESGNEGFYDGNDTTGTPTKYDKTANAIFLDSIPNYNYTDGLKVYINREGSYFTTVDTTKKAGFAGLFHEYLAIRPAYYYASRNSLPSAKSLYDRMSKMEDAIKSYYGKRERDLLGGHMKANVENTK